jgi:hypothetical protein
MGSTTVRKTFPTPTSASIADSWRTGDIEGPTDTLGPEFTYRNQDIHHSKMKIIELIPDEKVVWRVPDNHVNFIEDQNEWTGTEISFELTQHGQQSEVRFAHLGLDPDFECFDICSNAWALYINGSLRRLITTGQGQPNPKEADALTQR